MHLGLACICLCALVFLSVLEITHTKKVPRQVKDKDDVEIIAEDEIEEKLASMSISARRDAAKAEKKKVDEIKKLEKDVVAFQKKAELAKEGFGENSEEYATMIHSLGRNVYKLERYDEALKYAQEIVRIYEVLHGVESTEMANALGNVGSVSYRIKDMETCEKAMLRTLAILLREAKYDEGSKEVLVHRAKMLTFGIENAQTSMGITHEEYIGNADSVETGEEEGEL